MGRAVAALALLCVLGCDAAPPEPAPDWSFLAADLVAVDVLSRDHARLATAEGRVFETLDGGAAWRRLDPEPRLVRPSVDRFAVGAVVLPFQPASFEWRDGDTELAATARERLAGWAAKAVDWSGLVYEVEAHVSGDEIERFVPEGEAIRLFEILDARLSEARGVLEEAGIPPASIRPSGAPPWELEERIDEEPGLVAAYFAARRADRAGLRVGVREGRSAHAVVFANDRSRVGLAIGEHGAVWTTEDRGGRWLARPPPVDAALLAAVRLGDEWLVVDEVGRILRSQDGAQTWHVAPGAPGAGAALRAIDFSPDGALGLAVGDRGRIQVRRAGQSGWQSFARPGPGAGRP